MLPKLKEPEPEPCISVLFVELALAKAVLPGPELEEGESDLVNLGTTYLGPGIDKFFLVSQSFVSSSTSKILWIGGVCRNLMILDLIEYNHDLPVVEAIEPAFPDSVTSASRLSTFCALASDYIIEYLPYAS